MSRIQWRIYYKDKIHDSNQGPAPSRGVQAIIQRNPVTLWHTETRGDYYLLKDDQLYHAADHDGLVTEAISRGLLRPQIGIYHLVLHEGEWTRVDATGLSAWIEAQEWILQGETISNDRYHEILQEAYAAADWGRRTGWLPGERRPTS